MLGYVFMTDTAGQTEARFLPFINLVLFLPRLDHQGAATNATLTGLEPATGYYLDLWITNSVGDGERQAEPRAFSTTVAPPDAPVIAVGEVAEDSIEITWSEVGANGGILLGYEVTRRGWR